jgi:hypothetical protein
MSELKLRPPEEKKLFARWAKGSHLGGRRKAVPTVMRGRIRRFFEEENA